PVEVVGHRGEVQRSAELVGEDQAAVLVEVTEELVLLELLSAVCLEHLARASVEADGPAPLVLRRLVDLAGPDGHRPSGEAQLAAVEAARLTAPKPAVGDEVPQRVV